MIAFFDTNVFIDFLKGIFPKATYDQYREEYIIRMCPIVYHELIRGVKSKALKERMEDVTKQFIFLPPPTNAMWIKVGEIAGRVIGSYDERALEKIQNDLLIALTARENGATLITLSKFRNTFPLLSSFTTIGIKVLPRKGLCLFHTRHPEIESVLRNQPRR
jgi:predicted nucleic acid-binding protein